MDKDKLRLAVPVEYIGTDVPGEEPKDGIALCLSGGGYRAMLFHTGALWRLFETGILLELKRISSVSGGSITAAITALKWDSLQNPHDRDAFRQEVAEPIMNLAGRTIDIPAVLRSLLPPWSSSRALAASYRRHLLGGKTLKDLPEEPSFVINSTNMQSGALWRFMKHAMKDWKVGEIKEPALQLATAVAASSAFPPVLSPLVLKFKPQQYSDDYGAVDRSEELRTKVILTDAGVYDNLGLETAWKKFKTVLASDAGRPFQIKANVHGNLLAQTWRTLFLIDNQKRSLRKERLKLSYVQGTRNGTYWGIGSHQEDYHLDDPLEFPVEEARRLVEIRTRLKRIEPSTRKALVNWGYVMCDTALRKHFRPELEKPAMLPLE
jgi:NTE family protein